MDILTGAQGKYRKLILAGQFWERSDISALEEYVDICIRTGNPHVILDCDRLTFINSMAIGLIVRLYMQCNKAGGRLIIFQPKSNIKEVIEITGLSSFIAVACSSDELKKAMN